MLRFIGERALHAVIVVVLAAVGAFFLMEAVDGDAAATAVGPGATEEQYQLAREELGLDDPVMTRFANWAGGIVRGDLGDSLIPPSQPVTEMIGNALPVTMQLAFTAIILSLVIAVPVAVWSAYRRGGVFDQISSIVAFAFISVPSFVAGLLLIYLFVFNHSLAQQIIIGIAIVVGLAVALSPLGKRGSREEPGRMWSRALIGGFVVGGILALLALFLPEFPVRDSCRSPKIWGEPEQHRSAGTDARAHGGRDLHPCPADRHDLYPSAGLRALRPRQGDAYQARPGG
ncbi:ABC transporter permease [Dietzia aerolata]|uniref:ABC transporter permease n=1 Tax=Dietzia aerolata TaxID=595984 RepID=UPI0036375456